MRASTVWKTSWWQGRGSWSICCPLVLAEPCRGDLACPGVSLGPHNIPATVSIAGVTCGPFSQQIKSTVVYSLLSHHPFLQWQAMSVL